jgi:acyl-CoA synthetase (AMP-forming)/AMP-acid ligase II
VIASAANANIARHLGLMATSAPTTAALKIPRGRTPTGDIDYLTLTFAELAAEVAAWQKKLTDAGIQPGDRTLVMVRQGLPLIAAAFALFSIGAVPVVIDPGMGSKISSPALSAPVPARLSACRSRASLATSAGERLPR